VKGCVSLTVTDVALIGPLRLSDPLALAGVVTRWEQNGRALLPQSEVAVVIERDRADAHEVVRRLLAGADLHLRERADYWIEPAAPTPPQGSVRRPDRLPDFTLEPHDRVAQILCLPPSADVRLEAILRRLAVTVAQIDGYALPFVQLTEDGPEPVTVQRFLFRCGSSAYLPHTTDADFLDTICVAVQPLP
jgi:hypothetical protein